MNMSATMFRPACAAACLLAFAHEAAQALTTQHGSICSPYGVSSVDGLAINLQGFNNATGSVQTAACPVMRTSAVGVGGLSVWVDGNANSGTMNCTLWSFDYNGRFLGSNTFSASGIFDRVLSLTQAQVPTYSSQIVTCQMPNNSMIWDVEPTQ